MNDNDNEQESPSNEAVREWIESLKRGDVKHRGGIHVDYQDRRGKWIPATDEDQHGEE